MGMGHISIKAGFKGDRWVNVDALADTGATYCLLPPDIAIRAGPGRV
jgi:predicted aspartyl protease